MKRDLELIKAILLRFEEDGNLEIPEFSKAQVKYHLALLQDAGLITNEEFYDPDFGPAVLSRTRITWAGHEFLDASRSPTLWEKAKRITLEKTGALTFEVLKTVLIQVAKEAVSNLAT